jgi:hypothetical protein
MQSHDDFTAIFKEILSQKTLAKNPVPLSPPLAALPSLALVTRSDKVLDFRSFSETRGR